MQYENFFTVIAQIIPVLLLALAIEVRTQLMEEWRHPGLRNALHSAGNYWPATAALIPAELLALLVIFRSDATWFDAALAGVPTALGLTAVFLVIGASLDNSPTGSRKTPEQIERTGKAIADVIALLSIAVIWFSLGYLPFRLFLDPPYAAMPGGLVLISYAIWRWKGRPPEEGLDKQPELTGVAGE
jgi:hypothetical protein